MALCKPIVSFLLSSVGSRVHLLSLPWSHLKQFMNICVPSSVGMNLHFNYVLLGEWVVILLLQVI